jgi:hypothetical protein
MTRPWLNCEMRALGNEFCPVCREAHVIAYTDLVSFADDFSPWPGTQTALSSTGETFTVVPWSTAGLDFAWYLDGNLIDGATDASYHLMPDLMTDTIGWLSVTVTFPTDLVRATVLQENYAWNVTRPAGCCLAERGNVDSSPDDAVSLGDLSLLVDHLYISFAEPECWEEANVDGSQPEGEGSISLGDLTILIDHLFISFDPLPPCP